MEIFLNFAFCILHFAFYSLHFAFCILHFTACILHFAFCILPLRNPYLRHSHHVIPTVHIRQSLDDGSSLSLLEFEG